MTNNQPTELQKAQATIEAAREAEYAKFQGVDLPIGGEILNTGGYCMAQIYHTKRGQVLQITQEGAALYTNTTSYENDTPLAWISTRSVNPAETGLSTPWAICNDLDALQMIAECVAVKLDLLDNREPDDEYNEMTLDAIEEGCFYARAQLNSNNNPNQPA